MMQAPVHYCAAKAALKGMTQALAKEIGRLKLLFRAFRDASWEKRVANNDYYRFAEEADEHLAIVEALIEGDAKAASRAMAQHIRKGVKYWSRGLPM